MTYELQIFLVRMVKPDVGLNTFVIDIVVPILLFRFILFLDAQPYSSADINSSTTFQFLAAAHAHRSQRATGTFQRVMTPVAR